ncbi:hypothetical protein [Testudinibacter sp. TR-2022]|uniref:hypothetical protein n=1 Tax=Testudinibacter sp. TR-2022 TaxID=2585029 RepID=UPI001119B6A5|nr:hypothetical protein [Testudinibacter sp. TR-2022]TNH08852.1 hypothetical protein FHQ30_01780 [Pasteurellaceae bacterium Phil11]TNH25898.1 hypothetical protein FHQ29_00450 [Testudinibacter sp. TR-2022]TNH28477.1 hypothetical protein FHQ27_02780 [Testudinibacter sp. TR-2022]
MLIKEKGYDEYLAENIAAGRADIAAGRIVTLEEAELLTLEIVERIANEEVEFEQNIKAFA